VGGNSVSEGPRGFNRDQECRTETLFYDCKEGTISFFTQCYNPFDEKTFSSTLILPFLTLKNMLSLRCIEYILLC
jgi:hypothetical protein